jgi:hypothetical protein
VHTCRQRKTVERGTIDGNPRRHGTPALRWHQRSTAADYTTREGVEASCMRKMQSHRRQINPTLTRTCRLVVVVVEPHSTVAENDIRRTPSSHRTSPTHFGPSPLSSAGHPFLCRGISVSYYLSSIRRPFQSASSRGDCGGRQKRHTKDEREGTGLPMSTSQ